jgi:hypothetical protein
VRRVHAAWRVCAAAGSTCLSISLLSLDPPEQVDKVGWKGTVEHMRGRDAKDVADRHQDEIPDVFRFVR